jgi:hypothetical protein
MRPDTYLRFVRQACAALATGLILLIADGARADTQYKVQTIVKEGDPVGGLTIRGPLAVEGLTDSGQIVIARHAVGGGVLLMRYAAGQLTPLVVSDQDGPVGKWSPGAAIASLIGMSPLGNVTLSTQVTVDGQITQGTFLWSARTGKFSVVALNNGHELRSPRQDESGLIPPNLLVRPCVGHRPSPDWCSELANNMARASPGTTYCRPRLLGEHAG